MLEPDFLAFFDPFPGLKTIDKNTVYFLPNLTILVNFVNKRAKSCQTEMSPAPVAGERELILEFESVSYL